MKLAKYLFIFLSLSYLICGQVLSADCEDVSASTETVAVSCSDLDIGGDDSNVTQDNLILPD